MNRKLWEAITAFALALVLHLVLFSPYFVRPGTGIKAAPQNTSKAVAVVISEGDPAAALRRGLVEPPSTPLTPSASRVVGGSSHPARVAVAPAPVATVTPVQTSVPTPTPASDPAPAPDPAATAAPPSAPALAPPHPPAPRPGRAAGWPLEGPLGRGLVDVVKTRSAEAETPSGSEPGDWASPTREDGLPELRLSWESAEHFIRVARALEFRVVAVDARDKPAGLLRLGPGELRVEPLPPGAFVGYSTRGRTLGREAVPATARLLPSGEQAAGWWVLIPAQLDREFAAIQRRALDASGEEAKARDTREMVGRFKPDGSTFRLVLASPKPTASATGAAAGSRESQSAE